jgi:5'-phosphate synthase pdxT subunit
VKTIGILAIQGDFNKHAQVIHKLGHLPREIRNLDELSATDALIIPGGESTTFLRLFKQFNLSQGIRQYAKKHPIMGTCAGLIILSKEANNLPLQPLGLIDVTVARNAYGRQRESFVDTISLSLNGTVKNFPGVFIRAPKIIAIGPTVKILAHHKEDAVMVATKSILAATFHPELTDNIEIHQYFIKNFT